MTSPQPSPSGEQVQAHTPSPWHVSYDGCIANAQGHHVCAFLWDSFKEFNDSPRNKADARLIAAAPDLLAALEGLVRVSGYRHMDADGLAREAELGNGFAPYLIAARAAIARATT
jgi:hypothetical protein